MKTAKFIIGLFLIMSLGFFLIGCDEPGNSGDDAVTDEATLAPPEWIQGTWKFMQSTGYWSTYEFTTETVLFKDSSGASTDYASEYDTAEDTSTDSSYSITVGTTKYEWTLEDNGSLLYKMYYDGEESTSVTKHYTPSDMIAIDGDVLIDDEYVDYAVYVVAEDASENVLDDTGIVVEADKSTYGYTLYVDAGLDSYNVYAVVDPDGTFGNEDDTEIGLVDGDFSSVAAGDTSFDGDFPIAAVEGTVTLSSDPADTWRVLVAAFDSATPSGEPDYSYWENTTSGTTSYDYSFFLNADAFPDDAYIMGVVNNASDEEQEIGTYGSNPKTVVGGKTHSNINFSTN